MANRAYPTTKVVALVPLRSKPLILCSSLLLAAAAAGAGYYVLSEDAPESPYGAPYMRQYMEAHPGIPSLLPLRLPEKSRFMGHDATRTRNGKAVLRSATFAGTPFTAAPVQTLCVEVRSDRPDCLGTGRTGETGKVIRRTEGQLDITITFGDAMEPTDELIRFWESVPLSIDPNRIGWLQAPA